MPEEKFTETRLFYLDKILFEVTHSFYLVVILTVGIYNGCYYNLWLIAGYFTTNPFVKNILWQCILNSVNFFIELPFSIVNFVMFERKYKYSFCSLIFFIIKHFLSCVLLQLTSIPCNVMIVYFIIYFSHNLFIYLWLISLGITLILMSIYPEFIAPLHKRYIRCPQGALRRAVEELTTRINFPLKELYIIDGLAHSKFNKVEYCSFFQKYVALSSNLFSNDSKKNYNHDEILALITHEIAHYKYNHYYYLFIMVSIYYLIIFYTAFQMYYSSLLYESLGFPNGMMPMLVGISSIISYIITPLNAFLTYFMNLLTRTFVFQSDTFVVKVGLHKPLEKALLKLYENELMCCLFDPLYSCWNLSHPTLPERLASIQIERKRKIKRIRNVC